MTISHNIRVSNAIVTEQKDEGRWRARESQRTDGWMDAQTDGRVDLNRKVVISGKYSSLARVNSLCLDPSS